ncbi:MAG TPA: radical SAM protein [Desulfobacterales bacterium]|nr:radical SAM protein [Desulfobacterales bacterium]
MRSPKSILLIHPPVAKPCEPPAGLARLARALGGRGVDCRVFDANLAGLCDLLDRAPAAGDTWSRRALAGRDANLRALRGAALYKSLDRYKRAVMDTHRVLQLAGRAAGVEISLCNYGDPRLSPVRSGDLLQAAERFAENPFMGGLEKPLTDLLTARAPEIVGISINFMSQALCGFALAGWFRKRLPGARIVMGGGLVTSWGHIPGFGSPFGGLVDALVGGPGEGPLAALCGAQQRGQGDVGGFDYTPFDLGRYLSPGPILPYSTARGCYWRRCAFCPEKSENNGYHPIPGEAVLGDIAGLTAGFDPRLIHFLDNALSPRLLKRLALNPPGVPWYGFARITAGLADPDFARALRASGCVMLKLGVESGDQAVLDALEKGTDLSTVSRALKALKAAGIATYVYLLFGTPAETLPSARRTLAFTLNHAAVIDFLNLAVFNLPAYSPEARSLATLPFYEGDLSLYRQFVHPAGWQRDRVRRFLVAEFKKPAPIRAILRNDPPFFTSNHAALLKIP